MTTFIRSAATHACARPESPSSEAAGLAGTSFKHEHLAAILDDELHDGFFEVHAENYMGAGGAPHRALNAIRERHPISLHGVCMSIGGPDRLDADHLARFRMLVARYEPALVSEHLAWSSHGGAFFNDLLPLPYTGATLDKVCDHIDQVQEAIGRPLLLENPATYVTFSSSTLSEAGFIRAVAQRTGCGLLLDINNVFVSSVNHGFSAQAYLADFPLEYVGEIHLAGHSTQQDDNDAPLLIDSHDRAVADAVWALYRDVIARASPVPTLIEWDSQLPAWPALRAQAQIARRLLLAHVAAPTQNFQAAHTERIGHEARI
ncbi:MAG: MNIO family bufferin maturase [Bordetella sp.]|uniref:MNIO family bufferin maturase n=1 Tax=Bordetella sp. TaxID=28081 RepID=UPI003F7C864D